MRFHKLFIVFGALACLLFASASVLADDKEDPEKSDSFWMKQKLTFTQRILNGLATEDYDMIAQNARAMKGLNQIEAFIRRKPEGYRTQLQTFQFSVNELTRSADEENLDRATLAFTQMTISCVNCHKVLRQK